MNWAFFSTAQSGATFSKSRAQKECDRKRFEVLYTKFASLSPNFLNASHATDSSQVKSSHLYLYSAFNNTNCAKATAQYQ